MSRLLPRGLRLTLLLGWLLLSLSQGLLDRLLGRLSGGLLPLLLTLWWLFYPRRSVLLIHSFAPPKNVCASAPVEHWRPSKVC